MHLGKRHIFTSMRCLESLQWQFRTPGDPAPPLPLVQGWSILPSPLQQVGKIKLSPARLPGDPVSHTAWPCLHPFLNIFTATGLTQRLAVACGIQRCKLPCICASNACECVTLVLTSNLLWATYSSMLHGPAYTYPSASSTSLGCISMWL